MKTKQITYAGLFIACGTILPQLFHLIGGPGLGSILLPMHIPVLIAGFVLNPIGALIVGLLTPLVSFLHTGGSMPAVPMIYFMILELGAYGVVVSLLFRKYNRGVLLSLVGGMIGGRLVRGLAFVCATQLLGINLPAAMGIVSAITAGVPGIMIQFILIPPIIMMMKSKGGLIR